MAGTRSSARVTANADSSPKSQQEKAQTGTKRRAESNGSSQSKRGRNATTKKSQKTLEETMPIAENRLFREISRQKNPQPRAELWRRKLIRPKIFLLNHKTLLKSGIKMRLLKRPEEARNLEVLQRL
jgi:hypothetical protein